MNEQPAGERAPIFAARGFGVAADGQMQLADLTLDLSAGEILAVLGRHGAGGEALRDALLGLAGGAAETGTLTLGKPQAPAPRLVYLARGAQAPLSRHAGTLPQLARVLARRGKIPQASAREE
jgi:ABC-type hemin transport system ATPase subunit